jgi:multidrug efflux system membrane fusion protein
VPVSHYSIGILFCTGCVLALSSCQQQQAQTKGAAGPPVVPVSVAKAVEQSVPTELKIVGTVEASAIVQVKSQIAGQLLKVSFAEGQNVKQGEVLFQIDPQPYQDALRQAEAAVSRDRAQISQAEASLARDSAQAEYSKIDADRQDQLNKDGLASKAQADQARSTLDVNRATARATQATIDTARASLEADQAAVAKARLDLSHCQIPAPISGRTGNLLVHAGNLVKENDVALVVIHQVSPIFVNFSVPEQHLNAIRRLNSGRKLAVRAYLQDNPDRGSAGVLAVIDNTVDSTTGTIHLKAEFQNGDGMLWPGQFVNTVLTLDTIQNAIVIPAEAVQASQQGQYVYRVKPDNTVEIRPVTVGRAFGTKMVIEKGLAADDTVVTDGQLRLFPGAPIKAVDAGKLEGPL